jgi:hypothetical protein
MGEEEIIISVPTPKPFVQAACFCEKLLRESDNVASIIRVVDTYNIERPQLQLPAGLKMTLPLTIFVALKSGDVVGEHVISVRLSKPDGTYGPSREWPLMFGGGEKGVNLQIAFDLETPETGLYWFDVLWADEVLTRIPLRVNVKTADALGEATEREQT